MSETQRLLFSLQERLSAGDKSAREEFFRVFGDCVARIARRQQRMRDEINVRQNSRGRYRGNSGSYAVETFQPSGSLFQSEMQQTVAVDVQGNDTVLY